MSRPTVHPVEPPPARDVANQHQYQPRVRMKQVQGMPGTRGGLTLRSLQVAFGVVSVSFMATTSDFRSVTAFCYLVIAVSLQILWSLLLGIVDVYAIMVKRSLGKPVMIRFFAIGDGIMSTLTFAAACASAGITVLIGNDLNRCSVNHCVKFETAISMAFLSWFATMPSFLMNFWSLANSQ
ncbi:unnamed protein product [Linum tenue]|uniref:CASP-like protein n=1 Tax=Linum tenue TaxID=586396 RepID=A0AAV0PMR8_9ROSI|nr:unnamed protein product [Linum tenue]